MNKMNSGCQEYNKLLLITSPQCFTNFSDHHHCYICLSSPSFQYTYSVPPHCHFIYLQLVTEKKNTNMQFHQISTTCFKKYIYKNPKNLAYSLGIKSSFCFFSTAICSASLHKSSKFLFNGFSFFFSIVSLLSFLLK